MRRVNSSTFVRLTNRVGTTICFVCGMNERSPRTACASAAAVRVRLSGDKAKPDALNNLGNALLLTGRDQEARGLYEKALALQPDFPEALNNLGLLLGRAGDLAGAERYFREALARRDGYGEAANNLPLVLASRGDTDAAVRLLQQVLQRTPSTRRRI